MPSSTLDSLLQTLKEKGFRLTSARRGLLEIFVSSKFPLTANELLTQLKAQKISADKTTVYRELPFLVEQGMIRDVDFGDGQRRYERADEHHHHVVCSNCNRVEDIEVDKDIARIEKAVAERTKFQILKHSFEFFGLCQKCS